MSNFYYQQVLSALDENSLQKLLALGLQQECCNSRLSYILGAASMGLDDQKIDGVPQFVSYFVPIVKIMRDPGGERSAEGLGLCPRPDQPNPARFLTFFSNALFFFNKFSIKILDDRSDANSGISLPKMSQ